MSALAARHALLAATNELGSARRSLTEAEARLAALRSDQVVVGRPRPDWETIDRAERLVETRTRRVEAAVASEATSRATWEVARDEAIHVHAPEARAAARAVLFEAQAIVDAVAAAAVHRAAFEEAVGHLRRSQIALGHDGPPLELNGCRNALGGSIPFSAVGVPDVAVLRSVIGPLANSVSEDRAA